MYYRDSDTAIILHCGIQIPLVGNEVLLVFTLGCLVKSENYTFSRSEVFYNLLCSPDTVTYLVTYLLTPRSIVLLEKLTSSQLVKKFPAFYGPW